MKRYRIGQKKIIACTILAFSAIVAGAPAVTAFAEESAVPAETAETSELEALRLKKEEAQAAYDAALNDKLLAEDVVENAKRAVNDAQEEYDKILERYSTGFGGFLRWVIETETDPVKVEDARQVLEASFEDGTIVDLDDPANLTRMLYMADWLEDLSEYFSEEYGLEAGTSHAVMRFSQSGLGEYNEHLEKGVYEQVYDEAIHENEGLISLVKRAGIFKGMWYTNTDVPVSYPYDDKWIADCDGFQSDGLDYYTEKLYQTINSNMGVSILGHVMDNYGSVIDGSERVFLISTPFVDGLTSYEEYDYEEESAEYAAEESVQLPVDAQEDDVEYYSYVITYYGSVLQQEDNISENSVFYEDTATQATNVNTPVYKDTDFIRSPEILKEELEGIMDKLGYPLLFAEQLLYVMDTTEGITVGEAEHIYRYGLELLDKAKGITIGEAIGTDPVTGANVAMGSFFNGQGTYTVDEYVRALREYFSIADPSGAKAVLDERNDDLNNARKELAGAEEALLTAYGKLKGAEKEYEEAVAGSAGQAEIPSEEAGAALEAVYAGQVAVAADQADHANVINGSKNTAVTELSSDQYEISTTQDSAASAMVSDADPAGISPEAEETGQDVSEDGIFSEQISPESSVVSEQTEPENEAVETYSAAERQPEDTVTANVPDKVNRVTVAVDNSEINKADSAAAVTVSEETEENQDISIEKDKQKNGLLAEVLSYIFNGGAIAFILPAGFKRRKRNKSTGGILQGDF